MTDTQIKLKPEVKKKWVDALRSGKYQQGTGQLNTGTGFCCLGVLCDIYAQKNNQEWKPVTQEDIENALSIDEEGLVLPESVRLWADLSATNPIIEYSINPDDEDFCDFPYALSELNDGEHCDFNKLADLIEEQF